MEEANDIELRSEEIQEVLTRAPRWMIRWGSLVILIILFLVLLFSFFITYPDLISTEVVITTNIPPEKLIANSSGRIQEILVINEQEIESNTVLAIIENSASSSDVLRLKECLDTIDVDQFVFPYEAFLMLDLGEIQSGYMLFEKDYLAFDLHRRLHPHSIDKLALSREKNQLAQRRGILEEQVLLEQKEIRIKKEALNRDKELFEKGVIALNEWENKRLDFIQAEKSLKNLSSQLSQARSSMNDLNKSESSSDLNKSRDDINLERAAYQSLAQLRKSIQDWERMFVIRSSISGRVSFLQIWGVNQTITAGDQVFTVVPSDNIDYIAKAKAPARNSGKLKVGQVVNIRLANYPDQEFGIIKGRVKSISLTPDTEGNLLIDITLPSGIETSYEKKIEFQQEMSGSADIVTEDLRLIQRFFYQFKDIFKR
ncbi:HlyD family secretion protein [bacterium]|nr:HlyD family secretion protein [bacterium]